MSDPMTNVAIEDVLSSIRRLVSEDARVRPLPLRADTAAEVAADPALPEDAGRLVLTPALRVSDAAPEAEEQAPFVLDQPMTAADRAPEAPQDAVEEALDWEDHHEMAVAAVTQQDAEAEDVPDAGEAMGHDPDPAEAAMTGDDPAAEIADALPDADSQAEAVREALRASDLDEGDFVFASTRDGAPRAMDGGHDGATAPLSSAADEDLTADRDLLLREDEAILDEEMLRELVSDIVRQELQGALGERITRNVRKLVRREIHRALTSQELE